MEMSCRRGQMCPFTRSFYTVVFFILQGGEVPPADRSHAQRKMVLSHRARRGKIAEALLNGTQRNRPGRSSRRRFIVWSPWIEAQPHAAAAPYIHIFRLSVRLSACYR